MSRLIKCNNGHFYDADKYRACPHCHGGTAKKKDILLEGGISADLDDVKTVAIQPEAIAVPTGRSVRVPHVRGRTVRPDAEALRRRDEEALRRENASHREDKVPVAAAQEDSERTVGINQIFGSEVEPVTGWLVRLTGREWGKDYRLVKGRNRIGRDERMDVCLAHDAKITRQEHCALVYDDRSNESFLVPGNGTLTYHNGEMLTTPKALKSGDAIVIGETKLLFIAFCEGDRVWNDEE